jgi:hypothetical protein
MTETFGRVMGSALERLQEQMVALVPPTLAGAVILLVAYLLAPLSRWLILRVFKGLAIDRFLRRSGLAFILDPSGHLRAARAAAGAAYWGLLIGGVLTALSVFNTQLTTQIVQSVVFLLPNLVLAGAILLAGTWLSQHLARSALVWAVNESIPYPRRLAALVRVLLMFVAVVVAADQLDFARSVFLAAFIMIGGGLILTVSLAVGVGAGRGFGRFLAGRQEHTGSGAPEHTTDDRPQSLWSHL